MNYKQFLKYFNLGQIGHFYLFTGEEKYLIDNTLKVVKNLISEDLRDFNMLILDSEETALETINSFVETIPMMSDRKLLIIPDIVGVSGKKSSDFYAALLEIIPTLKDTTIIAVDPNGEMDKRIKFYKELKKEDLIVEFPRADEKEFERWVAKKLVDSGKTIGKNDLSLLIDLTGYNNYKSEVGLYDVENEINKIVNYVDGEEITGEAFGKVMSGVYDDNVFKFLEQVFSAKKTAYYALKELRNSNVSIHKVWYMVLRWARILYQTSVYYEKQYDKESIRSKLKISSYEFRNIYDISLKRSSEAWKEIFSEAERTDYLSKTKTFNMDVGLEAFIFKIINEI